MTDEPLTVAELEALLEGTSPGPWRMSGCTPWGSRVVANESGEMFVGVSAFTPMPMEGWSAEARENAGRVGAHKVADARLIAEAPRIAAALIAALGERPAGRGGYPKRYVEGLRADLAAALGERDEARDLVVLARYMEVVQEGHPEWCAMADAFLAAHPVAPLSPTEDEQ